MDIKGYEDYQIYPDGRVWSKKTKKFLKAYDNGHGYLYLKISCKLKIKKSFYIHRLVAEHYIHNPENKKEVDHINRNRSDNTFENLRWISHQDNQLNMGKRKDNTTGHSGICKTKDGTWRYDKWYKKKRLYKTFKTKTEALCFKYIQLLKIKAGNF